MSKKVLIFSTAYLPFVGGAEVAVKEVTDRISDWQFDMITARMDGKLSKAEKIGNVSVYRVGFGLKTLDKFLLPFLGCLKAARLHKKEPYAVAWSIMASQASVAAASFKKAFPQVKLLLTLQEGDEEEHLKRYVFGIDFLYKLFIRPWHLLVFRRADHISAISNYLKERALSNGAKVPIDIVPNGVDIQRFKVKSEKLKVDGLKQELGIKENEKVIITISRLVEKNAVGDLIDAMRYLPENFKLLIIGTGFLEENLKTRVKNLKLNNVLFLGGMPNDKVPAYLSISDVFVRPSLSEGLGNVFLEAMAAGVPVIGTNVGGIPDFLKDGETGLFCEVRDPKSIAEKIKLLLENSQLRDKIVVNAKKMVEERYDWEMIAGKMAGIFEKLTTDYK